MDQSRPLRWGWPWGPGAQGPHEGPYDGGRRSGSERREGAALPTVQTEEGPRGKAAAPLEAGRGGHGPPGAPGGAGPAHWDLAV